MFLVNSLKNKCDKYLRLDYCSNYDNNECYFNVVREFIPGTLNHMLMDGNAKVHEKPEHFEISLPE